jgi:two-component system sensor kinase FixL
MSQSHEVSAAMGLRSFLSAANDAVLVIDQQGHIEMLNPAGERMFGYCEQALLGRKLFVLLAPQCHRECEQSVCRSLTAGELRISSAGLDLSAKRRDGSIFPIEITIGQAEGASPPRFIAFVRDISEWHNALEALRLRQARHHWAEEVANLGSYVVHHGDRLQECWSPHLFHVLGLRYGGLHARIHEHLLSVVHPLERERLQEARADLESDVRSLDIEYRIMRSDGTWGGVHHRAQISRDAGRRLLREVGTLRSVSRIACVSYTEAS